jgi:hypothetical protein
VSPRMQHASVRGHTLRCQAAAAGPTAPTGNPGSPGTPAGGRVAALSQNLT